MAQGSVPVGSTSTKLQTCSRSRAGITRVRPSAICSTTVLQAPLPRFMKVLVFSEPITWRCLRQQNFHIVEATMSYHTIRCCQTRRIRNHREFLCHWLPQPKLCDKPKPKPRVALLPNTTSKQLATSGKSYQQLRHLVSVPKDTIPTPDTTQTSFNSSHCRTYQSNSVLHHGF